MTAGEDLQALAAELERAAERLRSGELGTAAAAELVEHVADTAGRLGAALEARARAAEAESGGQETLL